MRNKRENNEKCEIIKSKVIYIDGNKCKPLNREIIFKLHFGIKLTLFLR